MATLGTWRNRLCTALFLGVLFPQAAMALPVISIVATPDPAVVGMPLGLDVQVTGAVDLYAWQFSLSFNPGVMQATAVTEGPFLATGGSTFFGGGTIDNVLGKISFSFDTLVGPVSGVNGNGVLEHINFDVTHNGISALNFSDMVFLDSNLNALEVQAQNRTLVTTVVPEPGVMPLLLTAILAGFLTLRKRGARKDLSATARPLG